MKEKQTRRIFGLVLFYKMIKTYSSEYGNIPLYRINNKSRFTDLDNSAFVRIHNGKEKMQF